MDNKLEMTPLSGRRKAYDRVLRFLLYFCAAVTCALLIFVIGYIFVRGLPHIDWPFLSTQTSYIKDTIGILPNIAQHHLPGGHHPDHHPAPGRGGGGVPDRVRQEPAKLVAAIEFATETLTGIPSIIFGLVGMLFFCEKLGLGASLIAGCLTLVIVTIPTIIRTTQESLKTVPAVLPGGVPGPGGRQVAHDPHRGAALLHRRHRHRLHPGHRPHRGRVRRPAVHRRHGHGHERLLPVRGDFFHASASTLTVALYVYARERAEFDVAFAIAAILMLLTLLINLAASLVGRKLKRK